MNELEFTHEYHDHTLEDSETGETWEANMLATMATVDGIEYYVATSTGRVCPGGMTLEAWQASRQRINEIALRHHIMEERGGK